MLEAEYLLRGSTTSGSLLPSVTSKGTGAVSQEEETTERGRKKDSRPSLLFHRTHFSLASILKKTTFFFSECGSTVPHLSKAQPTCQHWGPSFLVMTHEDTLKPCLTPAILEGFFSLVPSHSERSSFWIIENSLTSALLLCASRTEHGWPGWRNRQGS